MSTLNPLILTAGLPLVGLLLAAPAAFGAFLLNATPAVLTLAGAAGWGSLLLRWLPLRDPAQQTVVALALGVGLLGHLTLGLALAGLLGQPTAAVLVVGGLAAGIWHLKGQPALGPAEHKPAWWGYLIPIGTAWALGVLLFAATLPPSMFWMIEAKGYDALEYHLQGPREWYLAGQMTFLPHNVYTSFPQQVEILYLLLMHLVGDPDIGAVASHLLHAFLTIAAVASVAVFVPPGVARWLTWLAVMTVPWLQVVGSLAYVEGGLLFFAAVSGGLLLRQEAPCWATLIAAAACAGFAGGCKYTALAFVAVALPLAWLCTSSLPWADRLKRFVVFGCVAGLVFAPWALRNAAFTGNPVYPFAYEVFGGAAWTPEQDEQWARGHAPAPFTIEEVARELIGNPIAGKPSPFAAFWPLALVGLLAIRSRVGAGAVLWAVLIVVIWAGVTHRPGRFAIVALAPLGLLLGHAFGSRRGLWVGGLAVAVALPWNTWASWQLLQESDGFWRRREITPADLAGRPEDFRAAHVLNQLPEDARVWLIADAAVFYIDRPLHYTVVFSRDPWLAFAAEAEPSPLETVAWLRERGWTHVAVHWPDVKRLRETYGFPQIVQPEWFIKLQQEGGLRPILPEAHEAGYTVWELP